MPNTHSASQSSLRMVDSPVLNPIELGCSSHEGSLCLNYCFECCHPLCEQCIEEHLEYHKHTSKALSAIKSLKRVREGCVDKLGVLIGDLVKKLESVKEPRSPEALLQEAKTNIEGMKALIFGIIEQEMKKFYEQVKSKISESACTYKTLEQTYSNMMAMISQLRETRQSIISGIEVPRNVQSAIQIDAGLFVDTFSREAAGYTHKVLSSEIDISFNDKKFRNSLAESIRVSKAPVDHSQQAGSNLRVQTSRALSNISLNTLNMTPRTSDFDSKKQQFTATMEAKVRQLHFFETSSANLHIFDLNDPRSVTKTTKVLNGYIVPVFHASLLSSTGDLFISGGIMEIGDSEIKSDRLSKYTRSNNGKESFRKDFAKVRPRSSHSICEFQDSIYILGGYGQLLKNDSSVEVEKTVQKVSMKTGEVEMQPKSRYGGPCIAFVLNKSIIKASEEGVEVFNPVRKQWTLLGNCPNYVYMRGNGWTHTSHDTLLVYGGYNHKEMGVDACFQWRFSHNELSIRNSKSRLPYKEGFSNNPGVVVEGCVFTLQNISQVEAEEEASYIVESEKALLQFDGSSWEVLTTVNK